MKAKYLFLCGLCLFAANWPQQLSARNAAAPRDYRQLIAGNELVKTLGDKLNLSSPLEVSQLQPSILTQPGDWVACIRESNSGLKLPQGPQPSGVPVQRMSEPPSVAYYAVFFADGAIVESRPAVLIDRCADMNYSPLSAEKTRKKPG
jgi:hypothetical protein